MDYDYYMFGDTATRAPCVKVECDRGVVGSRGALSTASVPMRADRSREVVMLNDDGDSLSTTTCRSGADGSPRSRCGGDEDEDGEECGVCCCAAVCKVMCRVLRSVVARVMRRPCAPRRMSSPRAKQFREGDFCGAVVTKNGIPRCRPRWWENSQSSFDDGSI